MKEADEEPATKKYFQWGLKILPMKIFLLKIQYVSLALSSDYEANENGSCCIHLSWILLALERALGAVYQSQP